MSTPSGKLSKQPNKVEIINNLNLLIEKAKKIPIDKNKYYVEFCHLLSSILKTDIQMYSDIISKILQDNKFFIPEILFFIKNINLKIFMDNYKGSNRVIQKEIKEALSLIENNELVSQISKLEVGRLDYETALMVATVTKERKGYNFNPIIFKDNIEFDKFILYIKENFDKFKGKEINFLRTGSHWISGKISLEIGEDGKEKVKLLIIDSSGKPAIILFSNSLIEQVSKTFPNSEIYITENKIQHSEKGCSIFSLFSLIKLSSIEYRLLNDKNFFSYLREKSPDKTLNIPLENEIAKVFSAKLPLPLLQLWQSTKLKSKEELQKLGYTEKELNDVALTKKNKAFLEVVAPFFIEIFGTEKQQNRRMEQILFKLKEYAMYYFILTGGQQLISMKQFSFEGWLRNLEKTSSQSLKDLNQQSDNVILLENKNKLEKISKSYDQTTTIIKEKLHNIIIQIAKKYLEDMFNNIITHEDLYAFQRIIDDIRNQKSISCIYEYIKDDIKSKVSAYGFNEDDISNLNDVMLPIEVLNLLKRNCILKQSDMLKKQNIFPLTVKDIPTIHPRVKLPVKRGQS